MLVISIVLLFCELKRVSHMGKILSPLTSVPYKCKKVQDFSGIFAKFGILSPTKTQRFYFSPNTVDSCSSRFHAYLCLHEDSKKLADLRPMTFFFS